MGDLSSLLQNLFSSGNNTAGSAMAYNPTNSSVLGGTGSITTPTADTSGILGTGLSGLQLGQLGITGLTGLMNGYLGYQNMRTAQRQADQAQSNWNKQWNANVKTTNASLNDRQAARVASNPTAYESVDSYMKKYGIS